MDNFPPIAIVGVGGVFPDALDVETLWQNVANRRDAAREVPEGRWDGSAQAVFDKAVGTTDRVYSLRGCFLDAVPSVAATQLDLDSELLAALDPAFHVLLQAGHAAFNDGETENTDRERIGVITGNIVLPTDSTTQIAYEYVGRTLEEKILGKTQLNGGARTHPLNRYAASLPAAVLAKALRLGGGSFSLDAACASSLYAMKLAVEELQAGRADAMLAGGLSRPDSLYTQMGFSQLRALSPTGRCAPFDAQADGLVVGEGAGMFLLKRVDDAVRDGDRIYAVIRGIGLSNDIGGGLLAPSSEGQVRAMRAAYEAAGLSPHDIDLIECHATGTSIGDATEYESLRTLWGGHGWSDGQCVIGSVKSNIGHLLTAAGAAALAKTVMALKHKTLPPTANFERPASKVQLEGGPFRILQRPEQWRRRDDRTPRRAAVSAFGFGGINAHVIIEEWTGAGESRRSRPVTKSPAATSDDGNAIAVVGMDACFGRWPTLQQFRERVFGGDAATLPTPPQDWWGARESGWFRLQGLVGNPFHGYYLDTVELALDSFRIPPTELKEMLPQQLLMLHVAARALHDSWHAKSDLQRDEANLRTGVFIGLELDLNTTNYSLRWSLERKARDWAPQLGLDLSPEDLHAWIDALKDEAGPALTANRTMGGLASITASRIAREFKFGGPSFTVASGNTSGLTALERAVRALQTRTCDRALAGAVDFPGDVRAALADHMLQPFSATGVCKPFEEGADGAIIGEGAAAVVLKRMQDAIRDGDRIYAVIKGAGTAASGGVETTAPESKAYARAVEQAQREAGTDPAEIRYIETHGSGNPAEDSVESLVLSRTFTGDQEHQHLLLGSAKADIGHAGAAAGMAGFVKTCLGLYTEVLPPMRNHVRTRADLLADAGRLHIPQGAQYWLRDRARGPRISAVSAMGGDGNCRCTVVEGIETETERQIYVEKLRPLGNQSEGLFVVEAHNVAALEVGLNRLRAFAEQEPDVPIEQLAAEWWQNNREDSSKGYALAFVARNVGELHSQTEFVHQTMTAHGPLQFRRDVSNAIPLFVRERVFFSPDPMGRDGKVAFVYPGSGNHYPGMGRELSVQWPEVYRRQDAENQYLASQFQPDVFWNSDSPQDINRNPKAALFGQVALGTAVTDLVQSFGIQPQAVVGYSLGETTALFAMRAWTDRDLMLRRINESTLFTEDLVGEYKAARKLWKVPSNSTVDWVLGVIDRPAKVVRAALQDHKKVYNLIVNTLHECVVGGDRHAVEKLVKKLDCEFFPLHGVSTVHCEVAKEVQQPYRDLHVLPTNAPAGVRFYSGAWGTAYNVSTESAADSVLAQAIYGIDYPKVVEAAYEDGVRIFLEMGPGASCSRMIGEILRGRPHVARSVCVQGQDSVSTLLRTLAQLIAERVPVDLSVLYGQETRLHMPSLEASASRTIRVTTGGGPFQAVPPPRQEMPTYDRQPELPEWELPEPDETVDAPKKEEVAAAIASKTEVADADRRTSTPRDPHAEPVEPAHAALAQSAVMEAPVMGGDAAAHEAYLRFAESTTRTLGEAVALQLSLLERMAVTESTQATIAPTSDQQGVTMRAPNAAPAPSARAAETGIAMDRAACLEFAVGSIAQSLGPAWADADAHPTRVRLPAEPLMLVDRILAFHGEPQSLTHGRVVTEHDVLPGAWYLDSGRAPSCITVEAGQADLILSAYLGIDRQTKGLAMYRLLDATVTFHRGLPVPGETVQYDIRIERFFKQGSTHLFRFNFDATIDGQPLLTMRDGCAGFFTREQIASGAGVINPLKDQTKNARMPADLQSFLPFERPESLNSAQVEALRVGDLAAGFGEVFAGVSLDQPIKLPGDRLGLVDEVPEMSADGGRYGLGYIRGGMVVRPDSWYLTCHFIDDMVMPGTLMYECALHTLRILLMRLGVVGDARNAAYEPVSGVTSRLKCRGEVNPSSDRVIYEVHVKERGYNPAPYALADTIMYVDGKPAVEIVDMSLQLTGTDRTFLGELWGRKRTTESERAAPLYNRRQILEFCDGDPSKAFGDQYRLFDNERFIARLPRPPFSFIDCIRKTTSPPWVMKPGGEVVAEYEVPRDAWYFAANRQPIMPYAVLLEIALQPCGWFAAYMGSALRSDDDLKFRNLGGRGRLHQIVTPEAGLLTTRVACTNISQSAGMIIQNYTFDVFNKHGSVYSGDTYFGFFTNQALSNQVGLRDAHLFHSSQSELSSDPLGPYPMDSPFPDKMLRMVDTVDLYDPHGGPRGLGLVLGSVSVDPRAWFFDAHFLNDPVWPGSLGLEGFLQLLKFVAVERWAVAPNPVVQAVSTGEEHSWSYRGQTTPRNERVEIQAGVTRVDDEHRVLRADGYLSVDGRPIYHMKDFTVRLSDRPINHP